jgi:hypothetical protein
LVDRKAQRKIRFANLTLRIKQKLAYTGILLISTTSDLFELVEKFATPTHRWTELVYFVLAGRHSDESCRKAYIELNACQSSATLGATRTRVLETVPANCHNMIQACFQVLLQPILHAGL